MTQQAIEKVRQLLQPTDDELHWYQRVMALDKAEAVPILMNILKDEQEREFTRRQAALILGLLGDKRAINTLSQVLNATDRVLRGRAAEALGQFKDLDEKIVQELVQGLQDEDYFVRECCAKALGQLQRLETLPALEQMRLTDSVLTNREVAQKAIQAIRGIA